MSLKGGESLFVDRDITAAHKFEIRRDDIHGRYLVASHDLAAGEVIFIEPALSWAPMLNTTPACLTCMKEVEGRFPCEACGWPMCGKGCSKNPVHSKQECPILNKSGFRPNLATWNFHELQPLYDVITVLRIWALRSRDEEVYQLMQDHLEEWMQRPDFMEKASQLVDAIKSHLRLQVKDRDVVRCLAVSLTNDFSHSHHSGGQMRVMFPLTALLNHSCFPNIARVITERDGRYVMTVRASRLIRCGEEIFNSYLDILQPTLLRRASLLQAKLMLCRCVRCKDPLDFGLNGNSVVCPHCVTGYLSPPSKDDSQEPWICWSCSKTVQGEKVGKLIDNIHEEQQQVLENKTVKKLEKFLDKWKKKLHPRHMLLVRVKYNLIGLYGRTAGYTMQEMSRVGWQRKKELCEEILDILKVLEPGLTARKGRIYYELHLPLAMLAGLDLRAGADKNAVKKQYQKALVTLQVATKIFGSEDDGSWEKRMVASCQEAARDLQHTIANL